MSDQAATCPSCGIAIAGEITRCPDCGEFIFKEQPYCPNCHCSINGASLSERPTTVAPVAPPAEEQQEEKTAPQPASRRPRKRRSGLTALLVAFVIALIVVFLGIYFMKNQEQQNERRAYENAIASSEPLVLQNFLDMYVDAPREHRDSVKAHLEVLRKIDTDWADALVNNSKRAFERYIKLHPQSVHNVEANIKIDSLDWVAATTENTSEAYQRYLSNHADGSYFDEARANYERIESQKITVEDRQMVSQLLTSYFNALAQQDESALTAAISPVLTSFLHRQNATLDDVRQYMVKLHEPGITSMKFTPGDDWSIDKVDMGDGRYSFTVEFTVVQQTARADEEGETKTVYKVNAKVSPENRISELNMKRSVQQ